MLEFIKIHPSDSVAVALKPLSQGSELEVAGQKVTLLEDVPQGHKFALKDIAEGEPITKYGASIGVAKESIKEGAWIHTHNVKTGLGDVLEYTYQPQEVEEKLSEEVFFDGYNRPNGKVGVRNEIWIIPTVGCMNNVATSIEKRAQKFVQGTVEDIIAFPHPYGCSQMGDDQENTRKILADLINHPNAGGVLVLGLGCENSNIEVLKEYIGEYDEKRVKFLVGQESEDEIADSLALIEELADYVGTFKREKINANIIIIYKNIFFFHFTCSTLRSGTLM